MPAAAYDLLDGPFTALISERGEAFAPVLLATPADTTLPLFSSAAAATAQLGRLPTRDGDGPRAHAFDADDLRAKEELLRAARALGAGSVTFDPDPDAAPAARLEISLALGHVEAYRRNVACL